MSLMIRFLSAGLFAGAAVRLEGPRLSLRPPEFRDWAAWAALRARSRAFLTPWEPAWPADTLTRASFSRRVRRQSAEWRDDLTYSFLTFERAGDSLVGGLGLGNIRRGVAQTATLGYWIGEPYARRGYTTEAVGLVLDHAFGELDLHRIEASCLPGNQASRRLLGKLGFTCEGEARGYLRIEGSWRDHLLFALLKDDWRRP
ncbi:MAG: GNAT family protein [Rhodospirillaceae bacterium]